MAFGRVCLIGDAAFVARPHAAAGTAKAAEDGWQLAQAIQTSPGDVVAALRAGNPHRWLWADRCLPAHAKRAAELKWTIPGELATRCRSAFIQLVIAQCYDSFTAYRKSEYATAAPCTTHALHLPLPGEDTEWC